MDLFNKFYTKSIQERLNILKKSKIISEVDYRFLTLNQTKLLPEVADRMIENYILNYELPFGLALNFIIDGEEKLIPMVTEEPSVIAAASNAGKITQPSGGFQTQMKKRAVIGQVIFKNVTNPIQAQEQLKMKEQELLALANAAHPSLLNYGGGAQKIETRIVPSDPVYNNPEFFIVHLIVDSAEAMGANIVNTMIEAIAPYIAEVVGGENLMNILSNYATESIVTATCKIAPQDLATSNINGTEVINRIVEASQLALVDPYRAVTHNKGIMNGMDALLVATGNDWRAVEAGAHAYASRNGQYRALSSWSKDETGYLNGIIELPISIGAVGGTLSVHPTAQLAHQILDDPSAEKLARIIGAIGLAQNLAALKALVTDGIQKGHMALQARALAIRVGAKGAIIDQLTAKLQEAEFMNTETAKEILNNLLTETNK